MPRNVVIVGLGEKSINLVVEEDFSVVSLKERICQRKVGFYIWVYKTTLNQHSCILPIAC